jgi:hypothetical protein
MAPKIVAMAAIPGRIVRGKHSRTNVGYSRYCQLTWKWWCERNGAEFVVLDAPLGGEEHRRLPPTVQRWLAPDLLAREFGANCEIAMIDADTMIRWDAPSLFHAAGGEFSAVRDVAVRWGHNALAAFREFFPEVGLSWWELFNTGVIVMNARHAPIMRDFVEFLAHRWPEIDNVIQAADVGTDQVLLNYFLRLRNTPVHFIPQPFNFLHCVNIGPAVTKFDSVLAQSPAEDAKEVLALSWLLDFIDLAYVWHFTNVLESREILMGETWRRVGHHYVASGEATTSSLES